MKNNKIIFFIILFIGFLFYIDYPRLIIYYSGLTNSKYKVIHIQENFFNDEHFIELDNYNNIFIHNNSNFIEYENNILIVICPKKLYKPRCNKHRIVEIKKLPSVIGYYFKNS